MLPLPLLWWLSLFLCKKVYPLLLRNTVSMAQTDFRCRLSLHVNTVLCSDIQVKCSLTIYWDDCMLDEGFSQESLIFRVTLYGRITTTEYLTPFLSIVCNHWTMLYTVVTLWTWTFLHDDVLWTVQDSFLTWTKFIFIIHELCVKDVYTHEKIMINVVLKVFYAVPVNQPALVTTYIERPPVYKDHIFHWPWIRFLIQTCAGGTRT